MYSKHFGTSKSHWQTIDVSIINYPTVCVCSTELLPNEGSKLNKWGIKLKVSLPGMSARIFLQIGGFIN